MRHILASLDSVASAADRTQKEAYNQVASVGIRTKVQGSRFKQSGLTRLSGRYNPPAETSALNPSTKQAQTWNILWKIIRVEKKKVNLIQRRSKSVEWLVKPLSLIQLMSYSKINSWTSMILLLYLLGKNKTWNSCNILVHFFPDPYCMCFFFTQLINCYFNLLSFQIIDL